MAIPGAFYQTGCKIHHTISEVLLLELSSSPQSGISRKIEGYCILIFIPLDRTQMVAKMERIFAMHKSITWFRLFFLRQEWKPNFTVYLSKVLEWSIGCWGKAGLPQVRILLAGAVILQPSGHCPRSQGPHAVRYRHCHRKDRRWFQIYLLFLIQNISILAYKLRHD